MRELPIYRDNDTGISVKQRDLICGECPIEECNEESLWCMYRFVTKPNDAQLALLKTKRSFRHRQYQRNYYLENREAKLEYQRERYAQKRTGTR